MSQTIDTAMTRQIATYLLLLVAAMVWAQDTTQVNKGRHITPVRPNTNVVKQPGRDVDPELIEQYITGWQHRKRLAKTRFATTIPATRDSPHCGSASTLSTLCSWLWGKITAAWTCMPP